MTDEKKPEDVPTDAPEDLTPAEVEARDALESIEKIGE